MANNKLVISLIYLELKAKTFNSQPDLNNKTS